MRIGIIGAGHAGVEAAKQAAASGAQVVLFSGESFPPYFRPRVVAMAFGHAQIDAMCIKPPAWYAQNGIDLRLNSPISQINIQTKSVGAGPCACPGRPQGAAPTISERFDSLIIAAGAGPVILPFVRSLPEDIIPLWDAKGALAIREKLATAKRLVIIGGGISGVEAAAYARAAGLEVTIVEKADRLMSLQLCKRAAAILARILENKGAKLRMNCSVTSVSKDRDGLKVEVSDPNQPSNIKNQTSISCDLILTTVGATRQLGAFQQAGLKTDWGIEVDEAMSTSAPGIFACGDIAQRDQIRISSVMRAVYQGRLAGANAVASAAGRPLETSATPVFPLSFLHDDIEIHAIGPFSVAQPPSAGITPGGGGATSNPPLQEKLLSDPASDTHRSVYLENGILRGVQMIGTREDFQRMTTLLGRLWESKD
jgi:NAD(P)H-nitrite reductase large subunit